MKYIGPDFCNITSSLTDEELLIQKTANEFVSQEFLPIVNEYYEKGSFPLDLIPKMGELGVQKCGLQMDQSLMLQ